jgi:hypothetical protein
MFMHRLKPSLDECAFKSNLKVLATQLGLFLSCKDESEQLAMILRPAVMEMLKRETLICKVVLYETHLLYMKDGALPDALIERKRVLR